MSIIFDRRCTTMLCLLLTVIMTAADIIPEIMVSLDPSASKAVPDGLNGIFFEEINHAGEGGLYNELINDRSFEGIVSATYPGFLNGSDPSMEISVTPADWDSWQVDNGSLTLTKDQPLNTHWPNVTVAAMLENGATLANYGFWGIPLQANEEVELTIWINSQQAGSEVSVSLQSGDGSSALSTVVTMTDGPIGTWSKSYISLKSSQDTSTARLAITAGSNTSVLIDQVSLWPAANGPEGSITPFRQDLLQMMKDLQPRVLRIPGGCFVEGYTVSDAYRWDWSVGPLEQRRGQLGYWKYWVSNGLGIKEYLDLNEELGTDLVWSINIGNSKGDNGDPSAQFTPQQVQDSDLFQRQIDQIDFILAETGPMAELRASAGHPAPYKLTFVSLGNEDCGHPSYVDNYKLFYNALKAKYPQLRYVANCDITLGPDGLDPQDQDLVDYHMYPGFVQYPEDPQNASQHMFQEWNRWETLGIGLLEADAVRQNRSTGVYVSEFATWETTAKTWPAGNLMSSIADAAFKIGMERSPEIVKMWAFAPLFSNSDQVSSCCVENAIVFNNQGVLKVPAYHVEQLFAMYQGNILLDTTFNFDTTYGRAQQFNITASTMCMDNACTNLVVKIVNFWPSPQNATVTLNSTRQMDTSVQRTVLTGPDPYQTNTYGNPTAVAPVTDTIQGSNQQINLQLPAYSLTILQINVASEAVGSDYVLTGGTASSDPQMPSQPVDYSGLQLPVTLGPQASQDGSIAGGEQSAASPATHPTAVLPNGRH